jgi:VWFA-related protein
MRGTALFLLVTSLAPSLSKAQFKSTVPLVVAPTVITDSKGHYVDGLTAQDLVLYDNSVPQPIQLDWTAYPIDLVVAIQTSSNSGAVIDKLGHCGILFSDLLAGDAGQTAIITFSDDVKVHQDFTAKADQITHSLRILRQEGSEAHALDALREALALLERRSSQRRRIILMIAEKRDRSSQAKLGDVVEQIERAGATIYWLTFSPFLQPFTVKPKTAEDLKPEAERIKTPACLACPGPDDTPVPPDLGPGSLVYGIGELFRMHKPDLSTLLPKTTGGRTLSFLKKDALEHAIQLVSAEVHRQYILTFQPKAGDAGNFHSIQVAVKDRPELKAKTRQGYWAIE